MIIRSKAPLRLGFGGGGTDLSPFCDNFGGNIINATFNMFAHVSIETRNDGKIEFNAFDIGESFFADATSKLDITDRKTLLAKGVYNRIVADYNDGNPISMTLISYSDAPMGSGLGGSSTMVVALVKAFCSLLELPLGEYEVARLAYKIERVDLGLKGGKQDQYAATFGGINSMEFYKNDVVVINPLKLSPNCLLELEESLLLFFTGESRESATIISQQIKSTSKKGDNLEAMHEVKKIALEMKNALLKGDIHEFGIAMNQGWLAKKRTSKSISNSLIDEIYNSAINSGATGGKISGAGGGGFLMFVMPPEKRTKVIQTLKKYSGVILSPHLHFSGAVSWKSK